MRKTKRLLLFNSSNLNWNCNQKCSYENLAYVYASTWNEEIDITTSWIHNLFFSLNFYSDM